MNEEQSCALLNFVCLENRIRWRSYEVLDDIPNRNTYQTVITNKTLSVSGSGSNQTKPDKVTVSLGVETTDTTAQAALESNSNLMNKVVNALKAQGVQENETSTSTFNITPNYNYSSNSNQGRLIGFTVSNSIQIESSNIESVSKWIDVAVSAGANNVNTFTSVCQIKN